MIYIEELEPGDCFVIENNSYLLTCDFKANSDRLCFCLSDGLPKWFSGSTIVSTNPIYYLDVNNNIIPIKESKKYDPDNKIS